ncbi:N-acetyltransferase family protein [Edaphovirga cremea]|uniref:GNAT family N-acetyltransferase n=1 Tax=Edaphovirga cremea TaxID=2267246 RepID=UPI003988F452
MLNIRQANGNDLHVLRKLAKESYYAHFGHLWRDKTDMEEFLEKEFTLPTLEKSLQSREHLWLLACKDDKEIGYAKVSWDVAIPESTLSGALLHKLYFLPDAVGSGHGKTLLCAIENYSREHQQPCLWLEVLKINPRAQNFYSRCGMEIVGETVFVSPSQNEGMWIMSKLLS